MIKTESTPVGATEIEQRIRDTADSVCKQLKDIYPANSPQNEEMDQKSCVTAAVKSAMVTMKQAIASPGETNILG